MDKIIETLNPYDIITSLIPGIVFCQFTDWFYGTVLVTDDTASLLISGYIFGQLISRVGSLIVEPVCKITKIIVMAPYNEWLEAKRLDNEISSITEKSTVFRSWVSLALIQIIMPYIVNLNDSVIMFGYWNFFILQLVALVFLLLAYRKQVAYARKRVCKALSR